VNRRPALLFYCQHSVGMGHLVRSVALVRELATRFDVTFVSGGKLPRGISLPDGSRCTNLPPLGMDASGRLVSHDRRRSVAGALSQRRRMLLDAYRASRPRVIVIELFPFGRRKFSVELEPLLEEVRACGAGETLVYCSLRDILVSRQNPDHDARAAQILNRCFAGVLVHSDPAFARLEESFSGRIADDVRVHYTGFVHRASRRPSAPALRPGTIVVSAGGGIVGEPLLRCALDAHTMLPPGSRRPLTLLAGPFLPQPAWNALRLAVRRHADVQLRRSVAELSGELARAAASISQCGYNTAMDLLAARVPALVVPFGEGAEDEQTKRARRLEALGLVRVLASGDLNPRRLAEEMASLATFRPATAAIDIGGAASTARLLSEAVAA
jgi:predicted glycosyltransferase